MGGVGRRKSTLFEKMSEELMKIGDIAAFFDVSVKALRIYEQKGIIKPVKVDPKTGYRYYSADQVKQLNALLDLQALGFRLEEIKQIMCDVLSEEELLLKMEEKRRIWQDTIEKAQAKIETITDIMERMKASNENSKFPEMTEDERAWHLVKMVCVENVKLQSMLSEAIWL